jgi:hypothetical protein
VKGIPERRRTTVNLWAIAVSVVSVFVLSSVYYGVAGHGAGDEAGGGRPAPWQVVLELCRSALVAVALAGLVDRMDLGLGGALVLGLVAWTAFPFVLLSGSVMWDRVPLRTAATHAGDWFLKLLVITAIVGVWR